MYWTYSIFDPATRLCVYIGQTNDFERRQAQHLTPPRERKDKPKSGSLQHWLASAHRRKVVPDFLILEVVETESESLQSETKWIDKFATIGHPLLNRWEEHTALIEAGKAPPSEHFTVYRPPDWKSPLGEMIPTEKKTGYRLSWAKDETFKAEDSVVIMPTKPKTGDN